MWPGTTGSGKSNLIHHLLTQIRSQGDQAIIVDTTGGMFSRFYDEEKDILLNPLDARSHNWNIWDEIINDYVLEDIAESMIPETRSFDTFWTQSARQLLCESIRYLCKNDLRTYNDLLDMTLKIPLKDLSRRLQGTSVSAIVDPAIDKTALSVRASLASNLRALESLKDAKPGSGLSLLNFAKEDDQTWLFLSCQPDQREFVKPLFSAWISLAIKGMMRRTEQSNSRTWIIIDELASLNRLPSFMLGFQDLNQLEEIYGPSNTKTLSNLTGTKVLFRNIDTDVAKRVASYLGEQEKQEATESISFGAHQMRDGVNLSHNKQTKSVVTASQIMMLKDLEAYLKFPGDFPTSKVKFEYLDVPSRATAFVERPIEPSNPQNVYQPEDQQTESVTSEIMPVIKLEQA
jgi:type IV conjugative transfer system coupling protein TraD